MAVRATPDVVYCGVVEDPRRPARYSWVRALLRVFSITHVTEMVAALSAGPDSILLPISFEEY